jgi:hypothetical protein
MSLEDYSNNEIAYAELFGGRLKKDGVIAEGEEATGCLIASRSARFDRRVGTLAANAKPK